MHPNQLYVRWTQLGGGAWAMILGLIAATALVRFAWTCAHQEPRVLGVEAATLLLLPAIALVAPFRRALVRARRRYRARGLLPVRLSGIAITLLVLGLLYGAVFPLFAGLELLLDGPRVRVSGTIQFWLALAYVIKVGMALAVARAGYLLLKRPSRLSTESPSNPAAR